MYLLIGFLGLVLLLSCWIGYRRMLLLKHLNRSRLINGSILAMVLLTLMTIAQWVGLLPEYIATKFIMALYISVGGFFCGSASRMITLRREAHDIAYVYHSFWTEVAPSIIAVLLITFGLYRTGILTLGPYTGMGITSGVSLFGFGCWGLTMNVVPEFRFLGIVILDQFVPWENIVAYEWKTSNGIQIDYVTSDHELTDFTTFIPDEDELLIERLLRKKFKEHEQNRKELIEEIS